MPLGGGRCGIRFLIQAHGMANGSIPYRCMALSGMEPLFALLRYGLRSARLLRIGVWLIAAGVLMLAFKCEQPLLGIEAARITGE